jgi:protoporphyrinogen IX oxidase
MVAWALVLHVFGLVLWVGGLLGTTILMRYHSVQSPGKGHQALTQLENIFLRGMADPGALFTILGGMILIASNSSYYLHARWLHIKLTFVILLIGLHWLIGTRSKGMGADSERYTRRDATLLLAAVVIIFLTILIVTLPGEVHLT